MEILGKLFGSATRVKMLRLFLFNPAEIFEKRDIIRRTKAWPKTVSYELSVLKSAGLLKRKTFYREVPVSRVHKGAVRKRKAIGWTLNPKFKYLNALQNFLIYATSPKENDIAKRLRGIGSLKLVIASGIFTQNTDSVIDLLVVGNGVRSAALETAIRRMETDFGRELRYAYFTTDDFRYRLNMYDRLLRDIFDYPHHIIINKLGIAR